MVPTGVTVDAGQLDSGSGSAPYAVSAKNSMADAPETNADITFGMRYTVTGTILMSIGHCLLATAITVLSLASWQPVITSISNDMLHNNMNPLDFFNKFPVILFVFLV